MQALFMEVLLQVRFHKLSHLLWINLEFALVLFSNMDKFAYTNNITIVEQNKVPMYGIRGCKRDNK